MKGAAKATEAELSQHFCHCHLVHYYETDAMGVAHHSNYLRFFEETRVAWLRARDLGAYHAPQKDFVLAVLETEVRHHRPAFLLDELRIYLELKFERLKFHFRYVIFSDKYPNEPVAWGRSLHMGLDQHFKVQRPPVELIEKLEREKWTETWPWSL